MHAVNHIVESLCTGQHEGRLDNCWLIRTASKPGGRESCAVLDRKLYPWTCKVYRRYLHTVNLIIVPLCTESGLDNCWQVCATSLVEDKVVQCKTDWCQVCSPQLPNVWTLWELCCPQGSSRLPAQRPNMTVCAIVYCTVTKQTTDLPKTGTTCLWSGYYRSKFCSSH